jgi:hypothetical protein
VTVRKAVNVRLCSRNNLTGFEWSMVPSVVQAGVWHVLVAFITLWAAQLVEGHHSFSAEFNASQPFRLDGEIVRVDWRNPHVWIYLLEYDGTGDSVTWAVETSAPAALTRRGVPKTLLSLGKRVGISGYRAKSGASVMRGEQLMLPDGQLFMLSSDQPTLR